MPIQIQSLQGPSAQPYFLQLAHLRISTFKDFPYLYAGSLQQEQAYLNTYFQSPHSTLLLALHNNNLIGFSSSIPLSEQSPDITQPFLHHNLPLNHFLYIGDFIILPPYRHQGILKKFLSLHQNHALSHHYQSLTFMTVLRPSSHPLCPPNYLPLDPLWQHLGFHKSPNLSISTSWPQIDSPSPQPNTLNVWIKNISQ